MILILVLFLSKMLLILLAFLTCKIRYRYRYWFPETIIPVSEIIIPVPVPVYITPHPYSNFITKKMNLFPDYFLLKAFLSSWQTLKLRIKVSALTVIRRKLNKCKLKKCKMFNFRSIRRMGAPKKTWDFFWQTEASLVEMDFRKKRFYYY